MISQIKTFPVSTGIVGTISGWASYDLLRASQIYAGIMAGIVSTATAIIVVPKAWAFVREHCLKKKRKRMKNQQKSQGHDHDKC